ncbi:MAG: hypothetical protein NTX61_12150 [Bacteroidetes bacterium]|nr:hypothetical protein [Bacteroidota bacterium]
MKKKTSTTFVLTFIAGAVFGVSIFVLLSFTSGTSLPPAQPLGSAIPLDTAKVYVQNFRHDFPKSLKGYAIDKDQVDAMIKLLADPAFFGFRVYNGEDFSHRIIAVVVGLTSDGKDITTKPIYLTSTLNVGPCPTSCDNSSPLN